MILFIIETRNQFSKTYLYIFIFKTTTYFMKTSKRKVALMFSIVSSTFLRAPKADWALDNGNRHSHNDW